MVSVFQKSHYKSLWRPIKNIRQFCLHVKWSVQRIRRGYSDYDCGDIPAWFTAVIADMLKAYERSLRTWKNEFGEAGQHPADFRWQFYQEHQKEMGRTLDEFCGSRAPKVDKWRKRADVACYQRWKAILDEMVFLFREADREEFDPPVSFEEEERYRSDCRGKAF